MKYSTLALTLAGLFLSGSLLAGCGSDTNAAGQSQNEEHARESDQHNAETEEQAREVHLSSKQVNSLGIKVESLSEGSASSTISRPATVSYDLDRIAKVGPRIEAKVVEVQKDLGDRVQKGEPIALMSSVELGKTKAEYIRLRARLKAEEARYQREQSLYEQDISSQAELLEAEATFQEAKAEMKAASEALRLYGLTKNDIADIEAGGKQPLSYFNLTSPLEGVIQERHLSPGETVGSGDTPIHVADLSRMWVMIDAYEQDIPYVQKGQQVSLSVRSIDGTTFPATTDWVSYALEKDTRTMPVRAVVQNTGGQLRAGMFGTARIATGRERNVAMIPIDAVQNIGSKKVVFVPGDETGSFKPVEVMLGDENEGYVEIASGLDPGDAAVVSGAFDLKSALTSKTRSASHGH